MSINLIQTGTASDLAFPTITGVTNNSAAVNRVMEVGGTPGGASSFTINNVTHACIAWTTPSGHFTDRVWAAGDVSVPINITTSNMNCTLARVIVRRLDSAGALQTTLADEAYSDSIGATGVITKTLAIAAQAGAASTDRLQVVVSFATANTMNQSFAVTSDQTVGTPIRPLIADAVDVYAQVFASDGTTALTNRVLVAANASISTTYATLTAAHTITGTPTKAQWDGARLKLEWDYTVNEIAQKVRVTAVDLPGYYEASAAPNVSPTAISSAESVSSATVTPGGVTATTTAISSAEAFGSIAVTTLSTLTLTSISSLEAIGSVTLTPGAVNLTPTGALSAEAFGSLSLGLGAVTLSPSAIASLELAGEPTLTSFFSLSPSAITSAEAVGSAVLSTWVSVSPTAIASLEAFGTHAVGSFTVLVPSAIVSAEQFGATTLSTLVVLAPSAITSAETFGVLVVEPGAVALAPGSIVTSEVLGNPTLAVGTVFLLPSGVATQEVLGTVAVSPGVVIVLPTGAASSEEFGAHIVQATALPGFLTPVGVSTEEALGTPILLTGVVLVIPDAVTTQEAFGSSTVYFSEEGLPPRGTFIVGRDHVRLGAH